MFQAGPPKQKGPLGGLEFDPNGGVLNSFGDDGMVMGGGIDPGGATMPQAPIDGGGGVFPGGLPQPQSPIDSGGGIFADPGNKPDPSNLPIFQAEPQGPASAPVTGLKGAAPTADGGVLNSFIGPQPPQAQAAAPPPLAPPAPPVTPQVAPATTASNLTSGAGAPQAPPQAHPASFEPGGGYQGQGPKPPRQVTGRSSNGTPMGGLMASTPRPLY